jgi:hypothetical protein
MMSTRYVSLLAIPKRHSVSLARCCPFQAFFYSGYSMALEDICFMSATISSLYCYDGRFYLPSFVFWRHPL